MAHNGEASSSRRQLQRRLADLSPVKRALVQADSGLGRLSRPAMLEVAGRIPKRAAGEAAPMSFPQELLWLLERANPGHAYNVPRSVRLHGRVDLDALQRALDVIVERHEVLRTTLAVVDGEPRQIVHEPQSVPLERIDLHSFPEAEREGEARRRLRELIRRPFDLTKDLQLRATWVALAEEDGVLLLESHHIATDGWSRNILMRELAVLYDAALRGISAELPEPQVQYADYALWQREWLSGRQLEDLLGYWRERLAHAPSILDLPTDRPRVEPTSYDGDVVAAIYAPVLLRRLQALSREHGVTLFMTLLAAFDVLLGRWCGEQDLVVGSPMSGRTRAETENTIGFFVNTLLLRTSLEGDPTFAELLERIRDVCLEAYDHQEIPFEKLVLELQRGRDGRTPLVQVLFALQDADGEPFRLTGTESAALGAARGASKFELSLQMHECSEGLRAVFEYRTQLFDASTIERLLRRLETLLEGIVAAPDTPLSLLPVLPEEERRLVVETWNQTATEYPRSATVHELFSDWARRTPDTVAIVQGDTSVTYAELEWRAQALAERLRERGVGQGALVGLCADRSPDVVMGMLGILNAGGAYVPLDPQYPPERLAFMLKDTAAGVVLAQKRMAPVLEAVRASQLREGGPPALEVLYMDEDMGGVGQGSHAGGEGTPDGAAEHPAVDSASPAYVMYTSGSTGRPKGVVVPHRAIVRLVRETDYVRLGPEEVLLGFAPISFDASTFEIWGALLNGGRLVLMRPGLPDIAELGVTARRYGVTTLWLTSALFNQVVDEGLDRLRGVRQLLAGGDVLSAHHIRKVLRELPNCRVINGYGPTENTTFTCCYEVPRQWADVGGEGKGLALPIGRPIANTRAYILDKWGEPAPIGVTGELYAAGDGLALGYLNCPELTEERFIPDSFGGAGGGRMYRTGDSARWRSDGVIEFLGRSDEQVKIRGFRVEPAETEAVLAAQPSVREVAVVPREGVGGRRLVAYVVPTSRDEFSTVALQVACKERLPDFMVPSVFVRMDALPQTPSGKLDRRALPDPESVAAPENSEGRVGARTIIEHELLHVWRELLPGRRISVRDDFFEIGGHSLLALRLLSEIERVRGRRLPISAIFENSTIERLARLLVQDVHRAGQSDVVVLQREGSKRPFAFAHGDVNGGGWYCRGLAALIDPDMPFVVLPTFRPDSPDAPATIEAMAAAHVDSLRKVQPKGPYRIGGYCHGGLIAYEMGRMLRAQGEDVERVVLVDPQPAGSSLRWFEPGLGLLSHMMRPERYLELRSRILWSVRYYSTRLRIVFRLPPGERFRRLGGVVRQMVTRALGMGGRAPEPPREGRLLIAEEVVRFVSRAQFAFVPRPYPGVVDVIPAVRDTTGPGSSRGWERVASGVRLHAIAKTGHLTVVAHHNLPALAERLRECLDET